MKKTLVLIAILILTGCEGSSGPVGPEGPPGPVGQGFEVTANFNDSNNYSQLFDFPSNVEALDTDIVVVYLLYSVDQQTAKDVWQQLPASFFFDDGSELQYSFDHTSSDVQIFLAGTADFSTLGADYTQDQVFRVAILPVDYVQSSKIDLNNMKAVTQAIGQGNFKKLNLTGK